jgi:hypothetical protein
MPANTSPSNAPPTAKTKTTGTTAKKQIALEFGALGVNTIRVQLKEQGYKIPDPKQLKLLQTAADSITFLLIQRVCTHAHARTIRQNIVRKALKLAVPINATPKQTSKTPSLARR